MKNEKNYTAKYSMLKNINKIYYGFLITFSNSFLYYSIYFGGFDILNKYYNKKNIAYQFSEASFITYLA